MSEQNSKEQNSNGNFPTPTKFSTVRIDVETKLSLMAALIFASYAELTEAEALNHAIKIADNTSAYVRGLKAGSRA